MSSTSRSSLRALALATIVTVMGAAPVGAAPSRPLPAPPPAVADAPSSASDGAGDGIEGAHSSHEDVGLELVAAPHDAAEPEGSTCAKGARVRVEHIAAIDVDIQLNRYGDHDPQGRMYVREDDLQRVRDEEARNAAARKGNGDPAVSLGLQGDAIQPLVLRVRPGECLRVVLRNGLTDGDAASMHAHATGMQVVGGGPDSASNEKAMAEPKAKVTYEWQVPDDEPEGSHYLHSAGNERAQVDHGLFGALVVEPKGASWVDPRTGKQAHGWDATVAVPGQKAFREFTLIYHEVGDETYQILDKSDQYVPLVDQLTQSYRPGGRALNYRSEPFMDRLQLGQSVTGFVDESVAYSSYSFGDPATPIMRTYLGEPTKQRVLHGGDEVHHVHHVHGGSIRWRRQPGAEPLAFADGLDKRPNLVPKASERTDSQTIGPSESFDVADECVAGGCQQSAGDFLYHCHIASHYFAGMWGIWRVYNTLQDGLASTDALPILRPLPDRVDKVAAAVPLSTLSEAQQAEVTTTQLPPPGVPKGYDASVWDWVRDGDRVLGEPETTAQWPGYRSPTPGARPEVLVDPSTNRLAYPFLRPHLAARPPFAPNHGPAPYLDPVANGADPAAPGASGPASTCPSGAKSKTFAVNAIRQPVPLSPSQHLLDSRGELFVLRQQEDAVRADPSLQVPLAIRANAGEDCVDILLRNEIEDNADTPHSKVSLHIHFVQFDAQASDGLDAGFNYEQTIRPFREQGILLSAPAAAGATAVRVADASSLSVGSVVGVGVDQDASFEARRIASIRGSTLTFDRPLGHAHGPGEVVSAEFVRYRWFVDAQFGSSYFHDHVDAIHSWSRGLFGSLIAEPPGSTYHDPHTGAELLSGPIADIHTTARVGNDVKGSFRELALFIQDDKHINSVGRSTGSAYNLRAEPLEGRGDDHTSPFSSAHGDPSTPILEANLGDPVVVRSLVGGTNDIHTVHLDGHWFKGEPWSASSPMIDTVQVGISERYDLVVPAAGGPQRRTGDYLYYSGRPSKLAEGSWGLVRVNGPGEGALRPLPGHEQVPKPATVTCPQGTPTRSFAVSAIEAPLPMLGGGLGKLYVLDQQREAVLAGKQPPEPLVLHAAVGDCVTISLTNRTSNGAATYTCFLPTDPATSGVGAGREPYTPVQPGETGTFTYYASPEVGETVAMVRDFGDVLHNPGLGLYGAIVVGAKGTTYRGSGWAVDAFPPDGAPYRDVTLLFQDEDQALGTHRMPYSKAVNGPVGINYQAAPIEARAGSSTNVADAYLLARHGDPPTPTIQAYVGDRMRIHVLEPYSEQAQVFSIEGHDWPVEPGLEGSRLAGSQSLGGLQAITIEPRGGAGGLAGVPGDYLYGDDRGPYREAGLWGVLRVTPRGEHVHGLRSLSRGGSPARTPLLLTVGAGLLVVSGVTLRRRRRHKDPGKTL